MKKLKIHWTQVKVARGRKPFLSPSTRALHRGALALHAPHTYTHLLAPERCEATEPVPRSPSALSASSAYLGSTMLIKN